MKQNIASIAENEKGIKVLRITFEYDIDMLYKIRSLPGRRYYTEPEPCWATPINPNIIKQLKEWGFIVDDKLQHHLDQIQENKQKILLTGIKGLKGTPRPFQYIGAGFIEVRNGRALIADEMGLGKTIQALMWLQMHRDKIPVVIVVPASLKLNWQREANKWIENPNTEILSGTKVWKTKGDILIINYDILFAWITELQRRKPKIIILDEVHYTKANSSRRTKAVKKIAKDIPHIIALSGTPIINRPVEIYNAIKLIDPLIFPNYIAFARRYCAMKYNGFGWDVSGASHTDELNSILTDSIMIRRLKKDVLKDLPDKVYSFVPLELDNDKEYKEAEKDFVQYVREQKGNEAAQRIENVEALAKIEGLKQLAVKGKLKQAIDWIKDFLESDNKLVVFCTHRFVVNALMDAFPDITVKIDGSIPLSKRQGIVDEFQNNPKIKLFVGSDAAAEGLNLTKAHHLIHLELGWTPGKMDQKTDRVHRMTQTEQVIIYYLLAANTIEEEIAKLLDHKRKVVTSVSDGEEVQQETLLHELMNKYLHKLESNKGKQTIIEVPEGELDMFKKHGVKTIVAGNKKYKIN